MFDNYSLYTTHCYKTEPNFLAYCKVPSSILFRCIEQCSETIIFLGTISANPTKLSVNFVANFLHNCSTLLDH